MNSIRISFRRRYLIALHYGLRALIVLTPLLVAWNQFGMNRSFVLDPENNARFVMNDDRANGGDSVGRATRAGKSMVSECNIGTRFEWPYCSLAIQFAPLSQGIDFSDYDSVTFDIGYTGPGPNLVRFYMRNYEPGISNINDPQSLKVNGIEFEVPQSGEVTVPMRSIQVASWWIVNRKIDLQHSDMRIDNVPFVELQTPTKVKPGEHRLLVRSVRFNGKWISEARLLRWLTRAWLLYGICRLIVELLDFRDNLRATKSKALKLVEALRARRGEDGRLATIAAVPAGSVVQLELPPAAISAPVAFSTANEAVETMDADMVIEEMESDTQAPVSAQPDSPETPRSGYLKRISTMVGNSMRIIQVDNILYFQSDQKYTRVVTAEFDVLIKKSLKDLMTELDPEQFWRVHRSIVVNALEVIAIEPDVGGQLAIKLKNRQERLPVSDTFVRKIRQMCT